jgi:aspartate aminotransferase/aminotransferase
MVLTAEETDAVARIAERTGIWLVSDEIYDFFTYDAPFVSPVGRAERVIQLGGFSKTYGVPGWRMGYVTGPAKVLDAMKTLQQFTFVCAPTPFQHALLEVGFDVDLSGHLRDYRHKRDNLVAGLDPRFALSAPEGSFYAFPRLPRGMDGDRFMHEALQRKLLVVPGKFFSSRDTHFRLSFAADDATLDRGIAALNDLIASAG